MRRVGLMVIGLVALTGCSTKSMNEMSYSELKAYAVEMQARCEKQGVKGDQEMKACINQEAMADQSRRRKQKEFGAAIAQAGEAYNQSYNANRPVNCTSTGYGNTVRTTCY